MYFSEGIKCAEFILRDAELHPSKMNSAHFIPSLAANFATFGEEQKINM